MVLCQGLQVSAATSAVGAVATWPHPALASSLCSAPAGINRGKNTLTMKGGPVPLLCAAATPRSAWTSPWVTPALLLPVYPHGMVRCLDPDFAQGFHATNSSLGRGRREVGKEAFRRRRVAHSPFRRGRNWAAQPQGAGSARACLLCAAAVLHVPPAHRKLLPALTRVRFPSQRPPPRACPGTLLGPKRAPAGHWDCAALGGNRDPPQVTAPGRCRCRCLAAFRRASE